MPRVLTPPRRGRYTPLEPGDALKVGRQYRAQSVRFRSGRDEGETSPAAEARAGEKRAAVGFIDPKARTVRFPFSSEFPAMRWWGMEILGHTKDDVIRWGRFTDGAGVLLQHDIRQLVGVTADPELVLDEARAWVTARFSRKALAGETFDDIEDDVMRNVSFAYEIWRLREIEAPDNAELFDPGAAPRDEGDLALDWWGPVPIGELGEARWFRARDWEPLEVSFVSVPLDPTVGVGRELAEQLERSGAAEALHPVRIDWKSPGDRGRSATEGGEMDEKTRRAKIRELAKKLGVIELGETAISKGTSFEDFRDQAIEHVGEEREAAGSGARAETPKPSKRKAKAKAAVPAGGRGEEEDEDEDEEPAGRSRVEATPSEPERKRSSEILKLGRRHNLMDLAEEALEKGWSLSSTRKAMLDKIGSRNGQPVTNDVLAEGGIQRQEARIGLTTEQVRGYSLSRLALGLAKGRVEEIAPFEHECSRAVEKEIGRTAMGALVPWEVLADTEFLPRSIRQQFLRNLQRTVITTGASGGGNLVGTDHMAGSFVEMLYAATVIGGLGATILDSLRGDIEIPTRTAGADVNWVAEDGASTEDASTTFGVIPADPKTMTIDVPMSRHMLLQSSPQVESLVRSDVLRQSLIAADSVAINGGGANQPSGILQTAGIGSVVAGDAAVSWDTAIDLEKEVDVDNALMGALSYLTNPNVVAQMKRTFIDTGSGRTIWDSRERTAPVNGYGCPRTTLVPNNLGGGSNRSAMIFGNFTDLVLCMWGTVDVISDPWTDVARGRLHIRLFQDMDVILRHVQSFAAAVDIDHAA